jgi:hypothetical protein
MKFSEIVSEGRVVDFPKTASVGKQDNVALKKGNVTPMPKRTANSNVSLTKDEQGRTVARGKTMADVYEEEKPGLWANIHAKRERIKHGSGERMRKPGSKGAPTAQAFKDSAKTSKSESVAENFADGKNPQDKGDSKRHGIPKHATLAQLDKMSHEGGRKGQLAHWQANMRRGRAKNEGYMQKALEEFSSDMDKIVGEDWNKVNQKDKTDGMSSKAVKAYRRENPGSKLQTAVTTKPSKLKPGSKAAKRRKSFCARMSGNKGPMKDEKGRPTPKAKALRRWNCNESSDMCKVCGQTPCNCTH